MQSDKAAAKAAREAAALAARDAARAHLAKTGAGGASLLHVPSALANAAGDNTLRALAIKQHLATMGAGAAAVVAEEDDGLPLPPGWQRASCPATRRAYWWALCAGISDAGSYVTWERPTEPPPPPPSGSGGGWGAVDGLAPSRL